MKKFLIAAVMMGAMCVTAPKADAQGCKPGGSYASSGTVPLYVAPTYTVTNTGSDTVLMTLGCKPTSIMFTNDMLKVSGTPAGTVTLYGSADLGLSYVSLTSYSVTVTSTTVPQVNQYLVNSTTGGNPYTNYMWVWTGTGTMVATWLAEVLIR